MRFLKLSILVTALLSMGAVTSWSGYRTGSTTSTAVFTTGTESAPSDTSTAQGLEISVIDSFTVHVEAAGALAAGSLDAYIYNVASGQWNPAPGLNVPIEGGDNSEASGGYDVLRPPAGTRIAFIPNGLGIANSVYIVGNLSE